MHLEIQIEAIGESVTNQTQYLVTIIKKNKIKWVIYRTYSNFRELRQEIYDYLKQNDDKNSQISFIRKKIDEIHFPSKRIFGSKKESVVNERAIELQHFLQQLLIQISIFYKNNKDSNDSLYNIIRTIGKMINYFLRPDKNNESLHSNNHLNIKSYDSSSSDTTNPNNNNILQDKMIESQQKIHKCKKKVEKHPLNHNNHLNGNNDLNNRSKVKRRNDIHVETDKIDEINYLDSTIILKGIKKLFLKYSNNEKRKVEMILSYIDRSISKAFVKTPGTYRIDQENNILLFNPEDLYEDLIYTFKFLDKEKLKELFYIPIQERMDIDIDYKIPSILHHYIQMKWLRFHEMDYDNNNNNNNNISIEYKDDNSESSETSLSSDYEELDEEESDYDQYSCIEDINNEKMDSLANLTRRPKMKSFTDDQIDELEKMQADGVAGKVQIIQMRRQLIDEGTDHVLIKK